MNDKKGSMKENEQNIPKVFFEGARDSLNESKEELLDEGIDILYSVVSGECNLDEATLYLGEEIGKTAFRGGIVRSTNEINEKINASKKLYENDNLNWLNDKKIDMLTCGINELCSVCIEEKTVDEVALVMKEKFKHEVIYEGVDRLVDLGVDKLKNSKFINNLSNSNEVLNMISFAVFIKDEFLACENSEEFFNNIVEKGKDKLYGIITTVVETTLISPAIASIIVSSMTVYTVCSELYSIANNISTEIKNVYKYKEKLKRVSELADEAVREMENQRTILEKTIKDEFETWDNHFDLGFKKIYYGSLNNNIEEISSGLNNILDVFSSKVSFTTKDEFDKFFDDENAIFEF